MWWPAVVKFPLRLDYDRSPHTYVNQNLQIQLDLLMMSGVPLETCWAFNERWNNKFNYKVASCWLFLLRHAAVSFPHGTKQQVFNFIRMRSPTPLFSLGLWRNKAIMATPEQKAFCVLQFVKDESVVSVKRAFRRQFSSDPPSPNSIRRWYQQFQTTGCLCKGKGAGRPRVRRKRGTSETVFSSQAEEKKHL
jgi:hypothetical protein